MELFKLNNGLLSRYSHEDNGLLMQYNSDQGDTLQRMSSYYTCLKYLNYTSSYHGLELSLSARVAYEVLEAEPNKYTRSANTGEWYDETERCSRDQKSITLIAWSMLGFTEHIKRQAKYLISRGFRHDNIYRNGLPKTTENKRPADFVSPSELGTIIRGLNLWYLYPVLLILDVDHFINTLISLYYNKWDQSNMLIPNLIMSNTKYPTPLSILSKYIVKRKRLEIEAQIVNYYSIEKNGIPPLGEIIIKAFRKLIGG